MDAMGLWIEKLKEDSETKKNHLACDIRFSQRLEMLRSFWKYPDSISHQDSLKVSNYYRFHSLSKSRKIFFSGNMCKNAHGELWMPFDGGVDISNENGPKYVDMTDIHLWCSYQNKHELACHQPTHPWCFYHCCFFCGKHIISSITFFSSSKGNCLYFHCLLSSIFPYKLTSTIKNEQKTPKFFKTQTLGIEIRSWLFGGILIHYELVWIKLNQTNFRIIPHITGEG